MWQSFWLKFFNNQYTYTYIYDYYYKSLSGIIFSLILKNKMTATGVSFFVLKDNLYWPQKYLILGIFLGGICVRIHTCNHVNNLSKSLVTWKLLHLENLFKYLFYPLRGQL